MLYLDFEKENHSMKRDKKTEQINLRVTKEEKERIKYLSKKSKQSSLSKYIINRSLNLENDDNLSFKRINTLTINPWILCRLNIKELNNNINYDTNDLNIEIMGSGIIASKIIKKFNLQTLTMHYSGGFTGKYLIDNLINENIEQIQYESEKNSRVNLDVFYDINKKISFAGEPSKINAISKQFILKKIRTFSSNDMFLITGDFHKDDEDFIYEMSKVANKNGVKLIFDLNKNFNNILLKFNPIIIKLKYIDLLNYYSNFKLIDDLSNKDNFEKFKKILLELREKGAQNILITFDSKRSMLYDSDSNFFTAFIDYEFKDKSYQGSDDVFIGAYVSNFLINSYEAFLYANATKMASISKEGIPSIDEINIMKKNVKIKKH
ncbi:MAG: tagatose-6-phosphate kinase [Candidatus Hepatoplasma vulgare]|nr:MAG: tagatose-6-phosphate kinase [Candidatus Hepatoplasma sp.]